MNIEKIELQCAETLLAYAETMADAYTNQPEDTEATLTALIGRTLELHLNRKINLENLYKWHKNQLSEHYKMAHLLPTK